MYAHIDSSLGTLLLTSNGACLTGVYFAGQVNAPDLSKKPDWRHVPEFELFVRATRELREYFAGTRTSFDLPCQFVQGTAFQQKVWQALASIPYGTTKSYRELATQLDAPKSTRAVASAIGKNPLSIIIPCHRIIGSDGSLNGYAGGLERKRVLLALEKDPDLHCEFIKDILIALEEIAK